MAGGGERGRTSWFWVFFLFCFVSTSKLVHENKYDVIRCSTRSCLVCNYICETKRKRKRDKGSKQLRTVIGAVFCLFLRDKSITATVDTLNYCYICWSPRLGLSYNCKYGCVRASGTGCRWENSVIVRYFFCH